MTDILENIAVDRIVVEPNRLRELQPAVVDQLAESFKEQGQIAPIVVTPSGSRYTLIAGAHRLAAAKKLELPTIRATVVDGLSVDQALLVEIDENLVRANLSPAEEAMHIAKKKEIYEKANPSAKHGGSRSSRQIGGLKKRAFAEETAKATGKSKRAIERAATRGKKLKKELPEVAGTSLDKGDEIDALAEMSEAERKPIIAAAKAGQKVSAKPKTAKKVATTAPVAGFSATTSSTATVAESAEARKAGYAKNEVAPPKRQPEQEFDADFDLSEGQPGTDIPVNVHIQAVCEESSELLLDECSGEWCIFAKVSIGPFGSKESAERWWAAQGKMPR